MELHDIGPVKLFDTAGIDEGGVLGEKKRRKTIGVLKESDVGVFVVTPSPDFATFTPDQLSQALVWEKKLLETADKHGVIPVLVLNIK